MFCIFDGINVLDTKCSDCFDAVSTGCHRGHTSASIGKTILHFTVSNDNTRLIYLSPIDQLLINLNGFRSTLLFENLDF